MFGEIPKTFTDSEFNLYRYCHNDPVNKIDPFGLYARGAGFSDDQWKRFDRAQMDAAAKLEKAIKTGDTRAFAEVFGKKAVTPGNMSKLANTMKSMVSALRDHGN